jgi:CheY-like chemotaxis protein
MQYTLKKGVLIIEDKPEDFEFIVKAFSKYGWETYPDETDYESNWNEIYLDTPPQEIAAFIEKYVTKNYRKISAIVLDIQLIKKKTMDQTGIDTVLPRIRKNIHTDDEDLNEWCAKVPVIALTWIPSKEIARTALTSDERADAFFRKDRFRKESNLLVFTTHSLYSTFRLRMEEGLDGVMNEKLDAMFEYMVRDKKAVISKLEDIEFIVKGGFESIEKRLKLILYGILSQMEDEKRGEFVPQFAAEIKQALGDEVFKKVEKSLEGPSFKEDFMNCIKKGTIADFSDFLTKTYKVLQKTGAINAFPFGSFIGMGLTTIFKILAN